MVANIEDKYLQLDKKKDSFDSSWGVDLLILAQPALLICWSSGTHSC